MAPALGEVAAFRVAAVLEADAGGAS
jgi:hypothetical protein